MKLELSKKSTEEVKQYIVPIITIIAVIFVGYWSFNYHFSSISAIRSELKKEEELEIVLDNRLETLRLVQVEVEETVDIATNALPQSNPSIYIISNLRSMSSERGIPISDLNIVATRSTQLSQDISLVLVELEVEADYENLHSFINDIQNVSPLINLSSLNINKSSNNDDILSASIGLKSFYSPLPETLPSIEEKLDGLTDEEKSTVSIIKAYRRPVISPTINTANQGKIDPFDVTLP